MNSTQLIKYGKSIGDLIAIKQDYLQNNNKNLDNMDRIAQIYMQQPKRTGCKLCGTPFSEPLFNSHGIPYYLCSSCNHLSGAYSDTAEFASSIYVDGDYHIVYSQTHKDEYMNRLKVIYTPKVDFLVESLLSDGVNLDNVNMLDIGAGSGYFVNACLQKGISCKGIEISSEQVKLANTMAGRHIVSEVSADDINATVAEANANVMSAIGVFEHVSDLHGLLNAVRSNKSVEYLYILVPMFSFSCVFEAVNQHGFNRHLGGGHTHLFTFESLNYLADLLGFDIVAQWRFGSDIMDLYRFTCVALEQNGNQQLKKYFEDRFISLIDDLQLTIDKSGFASEVHMVLRKKTL